MKRHIYLHTSNFEVTTHLNEDDQFESLPNYKPKEFLLLHQHEYGCIKTKQNFYHIILGNIKDDTCPWCNSPVELKKLGENKFTQYSHYCMKCPRCLSHGPILNVCFSAEQDQKYMDELFSFIKQRFSYRNSWDKNLVNHYENESDKVPK